MISSLCLSIFFYLNQMLERYQEFIIGFLTGAAGGLAIISASFAIVERKRVSRHRQQLQKLKCMDVSQFNRTLKNPGDIFTLRFNSLLPNPQQQQIDYFSNYKLFGFPNEQKILMEKVIMEQIQNYGRKWRAIDIRNPSETVELKGVKDILQGALEIKMTAIEDPNLQLPFYKRIFKSFSALLQGIFGILFFPILKLRKNFILFDGVKIGQINLDFNWSYNSLIATVEINDEGTPEVQVLGTTFDSLIQRTKQKVKALTFISIVSCAISMGIMYHMFKKIKTLTDSINMKKEKLKLREMVNKRYAKFEFDPADDQNQGVCAICMTCNKDLIFRKCMHAIQCMSCLIDGGWVEGLELYECPICKVRTDIIKIYSVEEID